MVGKKIPENEWIKSGANFICLLNGRNGTVCQKKLTVWSSLIYHRHRVHTMSNERRQKDNEKGRARTLKLRSKTNLVSNVNWRRLTGINLFPIESKLNRNSESFLHFMSLRPIFLPKQMNKDVYYGTVYALYRLAEGQTDPGLQEILLRHKFDCTFTVKLYFGTSYNSKTCTSLTRNGTSPVVSLMKSGWQCYRSDYRFCDGTSIENKHDAFMWQLFFKTLALFKREMSREPNKLYFEIINTNLQHKAAFEGNLPDELYELAIEFAQTQTPLIPVPRVHDPLNQHPTFEKYNF